MAVDLPSGESPADENDGTGPEQRSEDGSGEPATDDADAPGTDDQATESTADDLDSWVFPGEGDGDETADSTASEAATGSADGEEAAPESQDVRQDTDESAAANGSAEVAEDPTTASATPGRRAPPPEADSHRGTDTDSNQEQAVEPSTSLDESDHDSSASTAATDDGTPETSADGRGLTEHDITWNQWSREEKLRYLSPGLLFMVIFLVFVYVIPGYVDFSLYINSVIGAVVSLVVTRVYEQFVLRESILFY